MFGQYLTLKLMNKKTYKDLKILIGLNKKKLFQKDVDKGW